MPIPLTPLERAIGRFFWTPVLDQAVTIGRMLPGGEPSALFSRTNLTRGLMAPSQNFISRVVDRGEETLNAALRSGEMPEGAAAWSRARLREARRMMTLLGEHRQMRPAALNQADNWVEDYMVRHNLTKDHPDWLTMRKAVEAGDLRDPRVKELSAMVNRPRDAMGPFLTEAERAIPMNNFPVGIDATKVADNPIAFRRVTDLLAERVMRDPGLQGLAKEALVRPQSATLLNSEVSDLIRELVTQETKWRFRAIPGYVRSPARIFARRIAKDIPDEWRLHPYQEMLTGLHDEVSFLVDSKVFGRGGKTIQTAVDFLNGTLRPEDYAGLSKETLAELQRLRSLGLAHESTGPLFRELGSMVDRLARASTGAFQTEDWVWAVRNAFAPAGTISMMAFSAIPNMGQALSELIVRGWGAFQRGFIGADKVRARTMATLIGQQNAAMLLPDFHEGVLQNTGLLMGKAKGPGAIVKGELPSLANPRWYLDNVNVIRKHGLRGMRAVSEDFLKANGFSDVEDWLRRGSVLAVEQEIGDVQRRLAVNVHDAWALRKMKAYGFEDTKQFMQIKAPDLKAATEAFRSGDLLDSISLKDWQRAYFHGVGGTQFNYMPGDFPMIFANPVFGTIGLQFRRYSYSQATKVVSHILNEASAGNIRPLLWALATIPTGGEAIRRLRNLSQLKDVAFVDGKPIYAERPVVERGKEVRLPLGGVMTVDQRQMLENVVAMGLMGVYADALWTAAEDKPLLTASWMVGIFPTEVFNFVSKVASAGSEVAFGPEPGLGYSRVGGPKVQEAVRQTVREVPFVGRLVSPHVRWGRSRHQQLREHAMRTYLSGDFASFNTIQKVLVDEFYAPVTIDDIVNRAHRQALKEAGYSGEAPRPGDPGYREYTLLAEQEGRRRPRRGVTAADRAQAEEKSVKRTQEYLRRIGDTE